MHRHRSRFLITLLAVFFTWPALLAAADPPVDPNRNLAESVLRGILNERANFKSGVAEISGTRITRIKDQEELNVNGPIKGLYAFKLDGDKLRYDIEAPFRFIKSRNEKPDSLYLRFFYARNPECSAFWIDHDRPGVHCYVTLREPTRTPGGETALPTFDVHSAGIVDYSEFKSGSVLKQRIDKLIAGPISAVTQERDKVTIKWDYPYGQETLVVETQNGFRPVEYLLTTNNNSSRSLTRTRWQQVGNTDVPVEMEVVFDKPESKYHVEYHLSLNWKKLVNKPVNPKLFDYKFFRNVTTAPPTLVMDLRQHSRIIGVWKGDGVLDPPPKD